MTIKNKNATNIILISLSCYISLFIASAILNLIPSKNITELRIQEAKKQNLFFEEKTRLEKYNQLLNLKQDISLPVTLATIKQAKVIDSNIDKYLLPLSGGVSNSKILFGNEEGNYSYRFSDKFGFYNNNLDYLKKNKILIIGDSYGASATVDNKFSINNNLKEKGINVINLSVPDKAPLSYLASLREYGRYIKPKKVILLYYGQNDFFSLEGEIVNPILKQYYYNPNYKQNLIIRQDEINQISHKIINVIYNQWLNNRRESTNSQPKIKFSFLEIATIKPIRKLFKRSNPCNNIEYNDILSYNEEIMKKIKSFVEEELKAELKIIYIPSYSELKGHILCFKKDLLQKLKNNNIDYYDFSSVIPKDKFKEYFPFGLQGHFNEFGYRKLSDFIFNI